MNYPPTYTPATPPKKTDPMGQYSSWWNGQNQQNPYAGYTQQMGGQGNAMQGQANQLAQGAGQPWQAQGLPNGPRYDSWAKTSQQYGVPSQVGTVAAPTAQSAQPWMQELQGGQRSLMNELVKKMAGAGIRRGGMNVQGGAPMESSLFQQGIGQLGGMYGQNFGQAMGLAQNQAGWNRQNQMDQANWAQSQAQGAYGAGRQQGMDQYNSQLAQANDYNQQHWQDQANQRGWQDQLAGQAANSYGQQLSGMGQGATWDLSQQAAQRGDYGKDVLNYNNWRSANPWG